MGHWEEHLSLRRGRIAGESLPAFLGARCWATGWGQGEGSLPCSESWTRACSLLPLQGQMPSESCGAGKSSQVRAVRDGLWIMLISHIRANGVYTYLQSQCTFLESVGCRLPLHAPKWHVERRPPVREGFFGLPSLPSQSAGLHRHPRLPGNAGLQLPDMQQLPLAGSAGICETPPQLSVCLPASRLPLHKADPPEATDPVFLNPVASFPSASSS